MLRLNGVQQSDFVSYFMKVVTIPEFRGEHSGVGAIYWRIGIEDFDENVHLMGINSAYECHWACLLSTGGVCWIFRYTYATKKCTHTSQTLIIIINKSP